MRLLIISVLVAAMIGLMVPSASAATYKWNEKTLDWISIEVESFRVVEKDHYNRIIINNVIDGKNVPINAELELEIKHARLTNPDGQIYYYDEDECIEEFGRSTVFTPAFYRLKIDESDYGKIERNHGILITLQAFGGNYSGESELKPIYVNVNKRRNKFKKNFVET